MVVARSRLLPVHSGGRLQQGRQPAGQPQSIVSGHKNIPKSIPRTSSDAGDTSMLGLLI